MGRSGRDEAVKDQVMVFRMKKQWHSLESCVESVRVGINNHAMHLDPFLLVVSGITEATQGCQCSDPFPAFFEEICLVIGHWNADRSRA